MRAFYNQNLRQDTMTKLNYVITGLFLAASILLFGCESITDSDHYDRDLSANTLSNHQGSLVTSGIVVVTPDNLQGWQEENVRGDGASIISDDVADQYGGSASLRQSSSDGSGKTDFRLLQEFGPVSELTSMAFDWYRDGSSTAPGHLTPAIGVFVADDSGNSWLLKWEGAYNGYPSNGPGAPTDVWITENLLEGNYWRIPQFIDGAFVGFGGCNQIGDPYECFIFNRSLDDEWLEDYQIVGIEAGIGSGWNGTFVSYVDYININDTTFDFELEAAAQEPETRMDCMNGGWEEFGFRNQGQCIRFVNTGQDSR